MENIDLKEVLIFQDTLEEFKRDYIDKILERRDQMWHHRKGDFKDAKEASMYDEMRIKGEFLMGLYNGMKALCSCVALSSDAMEDYLKVIKDYQMMPNGRFRESLFTEQRTEMERVTNKIEKIFNYNSDTYSEISK